MARLAHVVVPGYPRHVTQRGNGGARTFFSDADYALYRDLFAENCRAGGGILAGNKKCTTIALGAWIIFVGPNVFVNVAYGKIDPAISLGATFGLVFGGVLFSLWKARRVFVSKATSAAQITRDLGHDDWAGSKRGGEWIL